MQVRQIYTPAPEPVKKRVCAYARVSSGSDEQLHSLSAQISYYSEMIGKNPDWEYAGVFSDEAFTGTKESRPGFQKMLSRCRTGEIQMIITKSISRFARNTVTVLQSVRELKAIGVDVFFEEQNIHSLSGEGEFMLSVLSSFAQEESRSCSENCKWRIRKDFQEGRPNTGRLLGYRLSGGVLTVVPEEAETVREIYRDYLSGMGMLAIVKKFRARGVFISKGGVSGILRNEKYIGSMLLQKTFVRDHLTKKKMKNTGQLPQFFVEDSHEAIIDRDTWDAVQDKIDRRANSHPPRKAPDSYPFTGLIRCGKCGAPYRRKHANAGKPYEKIVWICATFNTLGKAECDSQQIPESVLETLAEEVGGISQISEVMVPEANRLIFRMKNGSEIEREWQNPSRRESWTPEMREAARQRALQQRGKEKNW
ncbi:recombinase family protein [Caproicibacterium amylolyticum]|uniref:Recombinase family protein n=1 Tax=Caproicibacterium amylolyticum TaxID=2766537 RepID=A0A7G9WGQ1_9FIRM|nr:recombinase family protein [Caproicibacterium amylolyticum]QNO17863.1 recombinase family protein [Caproicibacterium amylolyticum]